MGAGLVIGNEGGCFMDWRLDLVSDSESTVVYLSVSGAGLGMQISIDRTAVRDLSALVARNIGGLRLGRCCGAPVFWAANQSANVHLMIGDGDARNISLALDRDALLSALS